MFVNNEFQPLLTWRLFSWEGLASSSLGKSGNEFSVETRYYRMFQLKMAGKVLFWETTNISKNVFPSLVSELICHIFISLKLLMKVVSCHQFTCSKFFFYFFFRWPGYMSPSFWPNGLLHTLQHSDATWRPWHRHNVWSLSSFSVSQLYFKTRRKGGEFFSGIIFLLLLLCGPRLSHKWVGEKEIRR